MELNNINFIPSGYVNNNVTSTHSVTNHPKSNLAKQMYNQLQQQQNQQSQQSLPIIKSLINIDDVDDSSQNTITNEATLSSSSSPNIDISTISPNSTQQHQTSSQPQPKQAKKHGLDLNNNLNQHKNNIRQGVKINELKLLTWQQLNLL